MSGNQLMLLGAASSVANYIEDMFSTYLYTGNDSSQTITNNIDLSGKGGLVWYKRRAPNVGNHYLIDSARGQTKFLSTNNANVQDDFGDGSFNSNGFTTPSSSLITQSGETYATWTFRKQPKFFDVVTYTGNGIAGRTIAHNLGSTPGLIIVKRLNLADAWQVYHRSLGATKFLFFGTSAAQTDSTVWNDTEPTSTVFTVGTEGRVNSNGGTYVAYLFAHNAGGFGLTGSDNVITCSSFTTNGSGNATVSLGYEPQWIMIKKSSSADGGVSDRWHIYDTVRGIPLTTSERVLDPNNDFAEYSTNFLDITSTGFNVINSNLPASETFVYVAIRRGPMKVPTSSATVFGANARSGTGANATVTGGSLVSDLAIIKNRGTTVTQSPFWATRMLYNNFLISSAGDAESGAGTSALQSNPWDVMNGIKVGTTSNITNASGETFVNYLFTRAPSFLDIVNVPTNQQTAPITTTHNLGVVPEMMIAKKRGLSAATGDWMVYHKDLNGGVTPQNYRLRLNATSTAAASSGVWNNTAPTATQFTIGTDSDVNSGSAGDATIVYLFASIPGVSSVGSYTGTGTTLQVNCGFTAGAQFVMIKRTDSASDWYVWDSARGIVSGNDPYFLMNLANAETTGTDYVDTYSAGFEISSTAPAAINANGGSFIFLAIA